MFEHMTDVDPDGPFSKELVRKPPSYVCEFDGADTITSGDFQSVSV
jgi:hypothetical protein